VAVTPARGTSDRKRRRVPIFRELRGVDMDRQQYELAAYDDPNPSAAWLRPLYICGVCGFHQVRTTGDAFVFVRVPHKCRLDE
jgi:hypothetical protein